MASRDQLKGNSQSRLSDVRGFGLFGLLGACRQSQACKLDEMCACKLCKSALHPIMPCSERRDIRLDQVQCCRPRQASTDQLIDSTALVKRANGYDHSSIGGFTAERDSAWFPTTQQC